MKVIVTGGAGFIGSALVRYLINTDQAEVWNLDKLTYAGNLETLSEIQDSSKYHFVQADICDKETVDSLITEVQPDAIMHLAAESHVDRSIDGPGAFIQTNIVGTYNMLDCVYRYWQGLTEEKQAGFRFHHISTDEVYGSLSAEGLFEETTPYDPRSPYSASKASSDHLVMAWFHTYGLPVVITNCSNNYGPYHFPEKLIPLVTLNAIDGKELPIYGKGDNIRDWLYVDDHAKALWLAVTKGVPGETYNVGGSNERTNLEVVETICDVLDEIKPMSKEDGSSGSYRDLITFVKDRPGHDKRYAIDSTKIQNELGWKAEENFDTGIRKTIQWYVDNQWWWGPIREKTYSGHRLGH